MNKRTNECLRKQSYRPYNRYMCKVQKNGGKKEKAKEHNKSDLSGELASIQNKTTE